MADFEEDPNPFQDDATEATVIDVSPSQEAQETPTPTSPVAAKSPPPTATSFRGYPGLTPKTGFCCVRDEYLHSDNAEIQATKPFDDLALC